MLYEIAVNNNSLLLRGDPPLAVRSARGAVHARVRATSARSRSGASMAAYSIRQATEADAASIAALWSSTYFDQPGTDDLPAEFLAERTLPSFQARAQSRVQNTLVACDGAGHLVGMVVVDELELEQCFVAASARG